MPLPPFFFLSFCLISTEIFSLRFGRPTFVQVDDDLGRYFKIAVSPDDGTYDPGCSGSFTMEAAAEGGCARVYELNRPSCRLLC